MLLGSRPHVRRFWEGSRVRVRVTVTERVPSMVLTRPIQPGPRSHQQDGGLRTS